jgi:hypothetical protein
MVFPCGDFNESRSPSLSSEGKLVTPIVLPKAENVETLPVEQRIMVLSGCRVKFVLIVPVEVASLNFHPTKLNAVVEIFLISTYSLFGNPTTGEGSAMISVITTSNLLAWPWEIRGTTKSEVSSSFR